MSRVEIDYSECAAVPAFPTVFPGAFLKKKNGARLLLLRVVVAVTRQLQSVTIGASCTKS